MSGILAFIIVMTAGYAFVAWLRADGGPVLDVARKDLAQIKAWIHGDDLIDPTPLPAPPGLFMVTGRHASYVEPDVPADQPRMKPRRQRGGVEIGPLPEGGGRVRNPNAPCWLCGQKKAANHKCI